MQHEKCYIIRPVGVMPTLCTLKYIYLQIKLKLADISDYIVTINAGY